MKGAIMPVLVGHRLIPALLIGANLALPFAALGKTAPAATSHSARCMNSQSGWIAALWSSAAHLLGWKSDGAIVTSGPGAPHVQTRKPAIGCVGDPNGLKCATP
jgi:hypothetical protein